MFFLVLLKRAKVPPLDIISFDHTCIRPVLVTAHPYTTMHRLACVSKGRLGAHSEAHVLNNISRPSIC